MATKVRAEFRRSVSKRAILALTSLLAMPHAAGVLAADRWEPITVRLIAAPSPLAASGTVKFPDEHAIAVTFRSRPTEEMKPAPLDQYPQQLSAAEQGVARAARTVGSLMAFCAHMRGVPFSTANTRTRKPIPRRENEGSRTREVREFCSARSMEEIASGVIWLEKAALSGDIEAMKALARSYDYFSNEQSQALQMQIFLDVALHGTAHHVETVVRHFRRARESQELSREAQQQASRSVHYYFDDDGSLVVKARLPAESGAILLKAFEAAMPDVQMPDVPAGTFVADVLAQSHGGSTRMEDRPSASTRRADALAIIAESFLEHGAMALNGGERHQIVVHVDGEVLQHAMAGRCELEDGPSLASETARRLACDASVVRIVENAAGQVLDVGRKTRSIPPALRRALTSRDRGCRFPGCTHSRFVDGHHIEHWARGGETKLSNLVSLCRWHHRLVHEGRVRVQVLDDGALRFVKPDGESFDSVAPGHSGAPGHWSALVAANCDRRVQVDADTAATRWRGEPIDYGLAVEVLLQRANRARDVPAGTRVRSC